MYSVVEKKKVNIGNRKEKKTPGTGKTKNKKQTRSNFYSREP